MLIGAGWVIVGLVFLTVKTAGFKKPAPDLTGPINIGMYE